MNLKELKEKIQELEKQGVIDDNTELVALGEYAEDYLTYKNLYDKFKGVDPEGRKY